MVPSLNEEIPMKFIALALLFSLPAMAKTVDVECTYIENAFRSQFTIEFSIDDEAATFEDKSFEFTLRPNGRDAETSELDLVRTGTLTVFPANVITKFPFFVLTSVVKDEEVQLMNIVVDFPEKLASTIRFKDGRTYNSTCKSK